MLFTKKTDNDFNLYYTLYDHSERKTVELQDVFDIIDECHLKMERMIFRDGSEDAEHTPRSFTFLLKGTMANHRKFREIGLADERLDVFKN